MGEKFLPADFRKVSVFFEALLRAIGGGVEMNENRPLNLSGHIVIDYPKPGVIRAQTLDRAIGDWNPADNIQAILTDEQREEYAERLVGAGVIPTDLSMQMSRATIRKLREEIDAMVKRAEELARQRKYLEELQQEDEEDERRQAKQGEPSTARRVKPRGIQRG